jgi:Leucine-rich repeat (LRR) protein
VEFPDSLKILLLGYNKLTSVEQIVFNTESVLEELNLANNEISSI